MAAKRPKAVAQEIRKLGGRTHALTQEMGGETLMHMRLGFRELWALVSSILVLAIACSTGCGGTEVQESNQPGEDAGGSGPMDSGPGGDTSVDHHAAGTGGSAGIDAGHDAAGTGGSAGHDAGAVCSSTLVDVVEVSVGATHACAVKQDGSLWCWGNNEYRQLGVGTN